MTSRPPGPAFPRRAPSLLALLGLLASIGPLRAQPASATPTAAEADTVLRQAMPALRPVLRAVLDRPEANRPVPWRDDASGLSGTITAAPATDDDTPCRAVRVVVQDGSRQLALDGQRCRRANGDWSPGRVSDAVVVVPEASPLIRDLQVALHRLDYYPGAVDGIASDAFTRALLLFERDEQVPPTPRPDPALLDLADAAIGRIPAAGDCRLPHPVPAGTSLACGSIRQVMAGSRPCTGPGPAPGATIVPAGRVTTPDPAMSETRTGPRPITGHRTVPDVMIIPAGRMTTLDPAMPETTTGSRSFIGHGPAFDPASIPAGQVTAPDRRCPRP